MVGTSADHDLSVIRGDVATYKCSIFYFRGATLIGLDSLNRPQDHMAGRRLLDQQVFLTPEQAADEGVALAGLLPKQATS